MKNQGTLVGAPVRINDDQDLYPSAYQSEIKGGHHKRTAFADLAIFPAHLKEAGMTCFVAEDSKTYQLANDLSTWSIYVTPVPAPGGGGGTVDPGTGGGTTTATIISGNFGEWTDLPAQSADLFDVQLALQYKADLSAFPSRATVFIKGQFGLDSELEATEITLGILPESARPKARLKKWMACKGVEMYLAIETTGEVKLISKDGFDLPVTTDGTENDPYHIEAFFNPDIEVVTPTTYTFTRTETFTRDNCGAGNAGTEVEFSKDYTSSISDDDAENIAMADSNFANLGQAHANAEGDCEVLPSASVTIVPIFPTPQTGAFNIFGFKIVSDIALEEAITITFSATYEPTSGGGDGSYEDSITLPPGELEYNPGGYPVNASPAASEPSVTVISASPEHGSEVTEYLTTNKLVLNAT